MPRFARSNRALHISHRRRFKHFSANVTCTCSRVCTIFSSLQSWHGPFDTSTRFPFSFPPANCETEVKSARHLQLNLHLVTREKDICGGCAINSTSFEGWMYGWRLIEAREMERKSEWKEKRWTNSGCLRSRVGPRRA